MSKYIKTDLLNKIFGRLTVIGAAPNIKSANGKKSSVAWLCECSCSAKTQKIIKAEGLVSGDTKSCGCLNKETAAQNWQNAIKIIRKYTPVEASAHKVYNDSYHEPNDTITFEEFYELSQQSCYYCKAAPNNKTNAFQGKNFSSESRKNGDFIYNGLDRVDNNIAHTKENCVPCCFVCNRGKRARSVDDFKAWIKRLHDNFLIKKGGKIR